MTVLESPELIAARMLMVLKMAAPFPGKRVESWALASSSEEGARGARAMALRARASGRLSEHSRRSRKRSPAASGWWEARRRRAERKRSR